MRTTSTAKIGIVSNIEEIRSTISARIMSQRMNPVFFKDSQDIFDTLEADSGLDALLVDLDEPDKNNAAMLPHLHKEYPLLKVVVISENCEPHWVRMAMHNGVFDFIPKPLNINDLDTTIKKTVSAAKVLQEKVNDYEDLVGIEHELDVARNIQSSIIPKDISDSSNSSYAISGRNQAAQKVGGDFFDYFMLDDRHLGFVIGDVASKGIPAAIFMAVSRTLFKAIALKGDDPANCLKELNQVLVAESDPSMFIAILYGILDLNSGELVYTNGGHTHPIIVRSDGSMQILDQAEDIVLGVLEGAEYHLHNEKMLPGDIFFTATDGFSELTDLHQKPVSDHFLKRNLIMHRHKEPEQILDEIYKSVGQIHPDNRSLSDDITCLVLKFSNCI